MIKPLFASVLRLDYKACQKLKIKDTYSIHRVVYSLFEDKRSQTEKKDSVSSGIQWVDKGMYNGRYRQILMLSDRIPKSRVNDQYGEVEHKQLSEKFFSYSNYRFEVMINPARRNNKTRQLLPVKGRQEIASWFAERAQKQWGFKVKEHNLQVDQVSVQQFTAKHPVTLQQAKVLGYFTVTNTEQFINSVTQGIGRARTFGCGLLQIVPVFPSSTQS
ncbi:MAG: type I-E CRISPR-associated protein Cas6/Cse3/CasE [Endozoicomonadaceae bacterium]|nr:type I-E CRISPR-associated protein Cas6/Cse3/CasE [Endozoicomonadaceae bacterium]